MDCHHAWPIAPNLLDQDFSAERRQPKVRQRHPLNLDPRRLAVSGGGYRPVRPPRRRLGHDGPAASGIGLTALRKGLIMRRPTPRLIHHADRSSQYCSADYQAELQQYGILT